MTQDNKDPYECTSCGTVNAWNQDTCRVCKTVRNAAADPQTESTVSSADNTSPIAQLPVSASTEATLPAAATMPPMPKRRWNAFWIFLGIAIHVVFIHLGVFSIIKVFIEPDPQLKTTIEETLEAARIGDTEKAAMLDNLPESVKSQLSTVRFILIFLLAVAPLLIGAATGFFSRSILEGAASMGLSAVLIPVLNGAAEFAILWGPLNAAIGALGAYIGYRLALRFKPSSSAVKA